MEFVTFYSASKLGYIHGIIQSFDSEARILIQISIKHSTKYEKLENQRVIYKYTYINEIVAVIGI